MTRRVFLDTNVFVYAFDSRYPDKKQTSRALVRRVTYDGSGVVSYQVVQEFLSLATRKFSGTMTLADLQAYLGSALWPLCRVYPSPVLYSAALMICGKTGWSFYDSLIVSAALEADCEVLYTEDLQAGRIFEGLEVRNPFV